MPIFISLAALILAYIVYRRLPVISPESCLNSPDRPRLSWNYRDIIFVFLSGLFTIILIGTVLVRIPGENRMLNLFSPDFSRQVTLIQDSVENSSFSLNIPERLTQNKPTAEDYFYGSELEYWRWSYGSFHINLSIATGLLIKLLIMSNPSYRVLAVVHSVWLLVSLLLTQALIYYWGRSLVNRFVGIIASLVYVFPYLIFQRTIHACFPDHIQQLLVLLVITLLAYHYHKLTGRIVFLAAFLSGMAFGTKFIGIFLLPLIFLGAVHLKENRKAWFCTVKRCMLLGLITASGFALGFSFASPQAVYWPQYFIKNMINTTKSLNYSSMFLHGIVSGYKSLLLNNLLNGDLLLFILIIIGAIWFLIKVLSGPKTSARQFYYAGASWSLLYIAILILLLRYYEAGVLLPIWFIMSLYVGMAIHIMNEGVYRFFFAENSVIFKTSLMILSLFVLGIYQFTAFPTAFSSVKTDFPIVFNLDAPFYGGVKTMNEFVLKEFKPNDKILVDYSQIYIPPKYKNVTFMSFVFMSKLVDPINNYDLAILTRSDDDFKKELKDKVYDTDLLLSSRKIYSDIRSGSDFSKVAEFDYPSGWFTSKVEIWRKVPQ